MHFDTQKNELSLKLVYFGPALSGKTTNLRALHGKLRPERRGHLMELPTSDDRTLFFDTMPVLFKRAGLRVKVRVFTVPGQVLHNSTRRVVLQGADGVAFVADSQPYKRHDNFLYWAHLEEHLKAEGSALERLPTVVQWNKADLGDAATAQAVAAMRLEGVRPVYEAVAIRGQGVIETFLGLTSLVHASLDRAEGVFQRVGLPLAAFDQELRASFTDLPEGLPTPTAVQRALKTGLA